MAKASAKRSTKRLSRAEVEAIFAAFQRANPEPKGELVAPNAFTLLVAVVLSAQATDAGVNKATRDLFKVVATPQEMLALGLAQLEQRIKTIGLYRNKAKNVMALSRQLIAEHGEGSFRDSISLLDQVRNSGEAVTLAAVEASLGIAPATVVDALISGLAAHDAPAITRQLRQAREQGYEPTRLAKQLGAALREQILSKDAVVPLHDALNIAAKLIEVPLSPEPQTYLEIVLLDAALASEKHASSEQARSAATRNAESAPTPQSTTPKPAPMATHSAPPATSRPAEPPKPQPSTAKKPEPKTTQPEPAPQPASNPEAPAATTETEAEKPTGTAVLDQASWNQVLARIKPQYNTLYTILKSAHATFSPGAVSLGFERAFHQKRAHDAKNRQIISDAIEAITNQAVRIDCVVLEKDAKPEPSAAPKPAEASVAPDPAISQPAVQAAAQATPPSTNDAVATISNIFGDAELLES